MRAWHGIGAILLLLGFVEVIHIHYHSHCTAEKANCEQYCYEQAD